MRSLLSFTSTLLLTSALTSVSSAQSGNVLVILADDIGVDMVQGYGVGDEPPATPRLDLLMSEGVSFTQAWSSPWCSPTRANILTGRYNFRTGLGHLVQAARAGFDPREVTLPEALDAGTDHAYAHAWIGKWHLANETDHPNLAPIIAGFEFARWTTANLGGLLFDQGFDGHEHWPYFDNGIPAESTTYSAAEQVNFCIEWIQNQTKPWVLFFAPNLAHAPWPTPPGFVLEPDPNDPDDRIVSSDRYKANVEYLDQEIGRLLDSFDATMIANTTVIFVSDNGTPNPAGVGPFPFDRRKGTVYQGGITVPLIVSGPMVTAPGRLNSDPVHVLDLFSTVLELAGAQVDSCTLGGELLDSLSLVPLMQDPLAPPVRERVYTERFANGQPNHKFMRAMTDGRYKLIQTQDEFAKFFDLSTDPFETVDLNDPINGPMTPEHTVIFRQLKRDIADLLRTEVDHQAGL